MYDLIIIGMGISGISASIYAKRAGMKVLLLESSAPGGTINKISEIENYPGIISISGPDLAYNLFEEVNKLNIEYKLERVTDVLLDETKTVKTTSNIYVAKYLLIASGRRPKMLGLKDEEKYLGRGISTCALCDGALYKNSDVAVVGGGSSALSEALYLANIVNKVYLIHRKEEFRGEDTLIKEVESKDNIELILNNEVTSLATKEDKIEGIISQKEFMMFRERFLKEIEECKNRIQIIDEELNKMEEKESNVQNSEAIFKKYRHIDKLNKEIVDEFIDTVWIGKVNPETNTRDIDIELNIIKLA